MPTCLLHLQEPRLNFHTLHALEVESIIKTVERDVLDFIVKDFKSLFALTRTKYLGSTMLKLKAKETKTKVTKIIETKVKL